MSDQRDAATLLAKAEQALAELDRRMAAVARASREARGRVARSAENLQLLVRSRQGQLELDTGSHGTDFGDAMLCHRAVVDAANALIGKHGDEKVGIMTRIQNFRKNINYMQWEHGYQHLQARGLEEHYTDLQLTKVTKFLQKFIKGGQRGDGHKIELEKCDAKLEHMKTAQRARLQKLQQKCTRLDRQHRDKVSENDKLGTQIAQLEANVKMREEIYKSRFESGGDAGGGGGAGAGEGEAAAQAQQRMRSITMRRKLIDLARAQTDEIEFLRQELDRLRQRTFPSFANAGGHGAAGGVDAL